MLTAGHYGIITCGIIQILYYTSFDLPMSTLNKFDLIWCYVAICILIIL